MAKSKQEIRDYFQLNKPTQEQLVASGDYEPFMPHGEFLEQIKQAHYYKLKCDCEQGWTANDLSEIFGTIVLNSTKDEEYVFMTELSQTEIFLLLKTSGVKILSLKQIAFSTYDKYKRKG